LAFESLRKKHSSYEDNYEDLVERNKAVDMVVSKGKILIKESLMEASEVLGQLAPDARVAELAKILVHEAIHRIHMPHTFQIIGTKYEDFFNDVVCAGTEINSKERALLIERNKTLIESSNSLNIGLRVGGAIVSFLYMDEDGSLKTIFTQGYDLNEAIVEKLARIGRNALTEIVKRTYKSDDFEDYGENDSDNIYSSVGDRRKTIKETDEYLNKIGLSNIHEIIVAMRDGTIPMHHIEHALGTDYL